MSKSKPCSHKYNKNEITTSQQKNSQQMSAVSL
jgi:hypothetical protein